MEIVGTWRSVVVRNRINKARGEAIADVEGISEENETASGREASSLNKVTRKEATQVKTMAIMSSLLQTVSRTPYLL